MPRWAIVQASGEAEAFRYNIHKELEGTEAQALAEMLRIIDTVADALTEAGRRRQRRRVFRVSDRSYTVRVESRGWSYDAHFTLAELIADTHDDELPSSATGSTQGP
ncbi:hypothetical protein [Streptomyces pseudovenezuelae]|uniref:hypothetical protein n=1 Tax=Streptomyces pseudovenezuelae TaxID=67350 RepID=UPI002E8058DD|nr:hypothetical protein [Streptomyces pseudovenezuelae]WUA89923.1 hypothetical protein OHO81_22610 [Streptomyces pseudovenezuelae]